MINLIFGILVIGYGLFMLITPYEKLKEKYPKVPAQKTLRVLSIILIIIGIFCLLEGAL